MENVIRQHPGVADVAVTGIPDPECGDLAVACVVKTPGQDVTADEIKDLVKGKIASICSFFNASNCKLTVFSDEM